MIYTNRRIATIIRQIADAHRFVVVTGASEIGSGTGLPTDCRSTTEIGGSQ